MAAPIHGVEVTCFRTLYNYYGIILSPVNLLYWQKKCSALITTLVYWQHALLTEITSKVVHYVSSITLNTSPLSNVHVFFCIS